MILLSIVLAILLVQTGAVHQFVLFFGGWRLASSFIAGFFFSSMFTVAPSIAVLSDLALTYPIWEVALVGASGTAIADLFIYRFIKDSLSQDILYLFNLSSSRRLKHIFRTKVFHWVPPLIGALIIASPLPDELAMLFFGMSDFKKRWFILISFVFNFLGILAVGFITRSL